MRGALKKYLRLREELLEADGALRRQKLREEMDRLWLELSREEQSEVNTCPGCLNPFEDAT